jgi:hypothetical protein
MNTIAGVVADQSAGTQKYLNSPTIASSDKERKTLRVDTQTKPKFVATSHEETEFWEDVT